MFASSDNTIEFYAALINFLIKIFICKQLDKIWQCRWSPEFHS